MARSQGHLGIPRTDVECVVLAIAGQYQAFRRPSASPNGKVQTQRHAVSATPAASRLEKATRGRPAGVEVG